MPNNLPTVRQDIVQPSYTVAEAKDFVESYNTAIQQVNGIARGSFSTFDNILPGISGRPQFDRSSYEHFRPGEALPKNYKDMVVLCDNMYHQFTLVRNVIDLMSDFACQGIRLVHPVKTIERFYNAWFNRVMGFDRSERFLNYLFRHAMVVCEAREGTISRKVEEEFKSLAGEEDVRQVISRQVPLDYVFHHPALVFPNNAEIINADSTYFKLIGEGAKYQNYINNLEGLAANKKKQLPPDKTFVHYYKRDEWQVKPIPFLYPLIKHAIMLEKLNLADSAALDGAISAVRIFKIGSLEFKIAPTATAVGKLNDILQCNQGGGTLDLIWGPDIELIESNTNVHQFLGEAKYAPHLHQMYVGLGVPPSLAGSGGTGTTNNYISIKVLTKRLQYGRRHLIDFWTKQIKWVQKAMKFARPAKLEFDFLDLGDEGTEKALLVQLADRNLISDEKLQSIFGYDSEMEKSRLNREHRERKNGRRTPKLTAMQDSLEDAVIKIALQKGYINAEQAGMEIEESSETSPFDKQLEVQKQKASAVPGKKAPKQARGRPVASKDKTKRKTKTFSPKIKAALNIWASEAQKQIGEILKPKFLNMVGKSNLRQLTSTEAKQLEKLTSGVLYNCKPFDKITKSSVSTLLSQPMSEEIYKEYLAYSAKVEKELTRTLTLDESRQIQSLIYSIIHERTL